MSAVQVDAPAVACPCCGSYAATEGVGLVPYQAPALLAVCDVLVVRALESVGKRIVRAERIRYRAMTTHPWHEAHTLWTPTAWMIDRGLEGSWDVIPAMLSDHGCCGVTARQVQQMIDSYVRDLLVTGYSHTLAELRYRFERFLGVPLQLPEEDHQHVGAQHA